jgi:hypothetical protein
LKSVGLRTTRTPFDKRHSVSPAERTVRARTIRPSVASETMGGSCAGGWSGLPPVMVGSRAGEAVLRFDNAAVTGGGSEWLASPGRVEAVGCAAL